APVWTPAVPLTNREATRILVASVGQGASPAHPLDEALSTAPSGVRQQARKPRLPSGVCLFASAVRPVGEGSLPHAGRPRAGREGPEQGPGSTEPGGGGETMAREVLATAVLIGAVVLIAAATDAL